MNHYPHLLNLIQSPPNGHTFNNQTFNPLSGPISVLYRHIQKPYETKTIHFTLSGWGVQGAVGSNNTPRPSNQTVKNTLLIHLLAPFEYSLYMHTQINHK